MDLLFITFFNNSQSLIVNGDSYKSSIDITSFDFFSVEYVKYVFSKFDFWDIEIQHTTFLCVGFQKLDF